MSSKQTYIINFKKLSKKPLPPTKFKQYKNIVKKTKQTCLTFKKNDNKSNEIL
jgi:hypothetical protein